MARRCDDVGQGAGWGGPAKGGGTSKASKAPQFAPGNRAAVSGHNLSRSARRQELLDTLFHLAFNAESEELQVSAAVAWLDRVEGKPAAC